MIVAQLLNKNRETKGIAQAKFLEGTGLSQSSWSRINRGLSIFSLEEVRAACAFLKLNMPDLMRRADKAAELLPKQEDIQVLQSTKGTDNKALLPTIIAAAALGFLIARILRSN